MPRLAWPGAISEVLVLRAAAEHAPDAAALHALEQLLALEDDTRALSYRDTRRGISKRLLAEEGVLNGARLTGETAPREWLKDSMARGLALSKLRSWAAGAAGGTAFRPGQPRQAWYATA